MLSLRALRLWVKIIFLTQRRKARKENQIFTVDLVSIYNAPFAVSAEFPELNSPKNE